MFSIVWPPLLLVNFYLSPLFIFPAFSVPVADSKTCCFLVRQNLTA